MSSLFVVGTPIGNLEDVTLRALRVLREADIVLCEDTRVTKRLLEKYEIADKKLSAWNEEKSGTSISKVLGWLEEGKNVALVTDAGTPGISDPGARLVRGVREAGFQVVSVPGPSAITSAFSIAGVLGAEFTFFGFLPHKKGRETLFKEIAASKRPSVFYESPHRIEKTLESLTKHLAEEREVIVLRELTKIYEEVVGGSARDVQKYFALHTEKIRGEFVVIVS